MRKHEIEYQRAISLSRKAGEWQRRVEKLRDELIAAEISCREAIAEAEAAFDNAAVMRKGKPRYNTEIVFDED